MRRLLAALAVVFALASPAEAHKLKVFATVEDHAIRGYAFFIGGGRPDGSSWIAKDAAGAQIATGTTDAEGRFAFAVPTTVATDVTVTVDTHEAHIASATIAAARFTDAPAEPAPPTTATSASPAQAQDHTKIDALVRAAVQKEVEPVLERLEAMDSRLRYTDILSGIFLIIGLVGIGLWARGKRR